MEYTVFINIEKKRRFRKPKKESFIIGFIFNMNLWQRLSLYTGLKPVDYGSMSDEVFLRKLYYCACEQWHLERNVYRKIDEDMVTKWIEGMTMKQGSELNTVLLTSKIGGESLIDLIPKAYEAQEAEKKKLHGLKSETTQSV